MKDMAEWLRTEVLLRNYRIDWQGKEYLLGWIMNGITYRHTM